MAQSPRERVAELLGNLREAARLHDPIARSVVEVVKLLADEAKESLVSAEGEDMLRLQGGARQLAKIYRELTITPPNIQPKSAQEQ
jgi:N-acetylglucosamine kinase-like BadF-type ATPase